MATSLGKSSIQGSGATLNRSMIGTVNRSLNGLKTASVASTVIAPAVEERVSVRGATGIDALFLFLWTPRCFNR